MAFSGIATGERYGKSEEARLRLDALLEKARGLETKLFAPLGFNPSDLLQLNHTRRKL